MSTSSKKIFELLGVKTSIEFITGLIQEYNNDYKEEFVNPLLRVEIITNRSSKASCGVDVIGKLSSNDINSELYFGFINLINVNTELINIRGVCDQVDYKWALSYFIKLGEYLEKSLGIHLNDIYSLEETATTSNEDFNSQDEFFTHATPYDFSAFMKTLKGKIREIFDINTRITNERYTFDGGIIAARVTGYKSVEPSDNPIYTYFSVQEFKGEGKITSLKIREGKTRITVDYDVTKNHLTEAWGIIKDELHRLNYILTEDNEKSNTEQTITYQLPQKPPNDAMVKQWLAYYNELRKFKKFTLKDLAQVSGYSFSHLSKQNPIYKREMGIDD